VIDTVATVVPALVPGSTVAVPAIVPPFCGVRVAVIFIPWPSLVTAARADTVADDKMAPWPGRLPFCAYATVLNTAATVAMVRRDTMRHASNQRK
jgi:hypothetical protein